ncbi:MAG: ABC transporter ATP-binding protein [Anaerostipes sp.]|nr:ABC transporter ATP-binding protein [Anaerostipes sp.]
MKKKKEKQGLFLLMEWAGNEKYYMYAAMVLTLVISMMAVVPYYVFYRMMDTVVKGTCTMERSVMYICIAFVSILVRHILMPTASLLSHKGAYHTLYKVRCMVTEHMSKIPLGALNARSSGQIKTVMNESIEKLELFLAHNLVELVQYLSGPIVIFIYLCTVNVPLALISIVPLVLIAFIMVVMFSRMGKYMDRVNTTGAALSGAIIEYISGMRLIKAYHMGTKSFHKYANAIEDSHTLWGDISRATGFLYAFYVVLLECSVVFIVPLGGYWFLKGSIEASTLLLFAFIGTQYLTDIRPLQEMASSLSYVINGVNQVKEIMDIPVFTGSRSFPAEHDIEISHVTFAYEKGKEVLCDCNLHINHGEQIAFVGESGAGKTTLVELIARFYDVTDGIIKIGGVNIKEISYEELLQNISIVFQQSFLTSGSVFENIAMGVKNITLKEVREAAKSAQIDEYIMHLPEGYDTKVGSYAGRFSGGERQRICIARAILKNAPILILDEATSAADPENQLEVDKAIYNLCKGKTVIIVAHRLGIVQSCDRIAVIRNRTMEQVGIWDEMLDSNSYFKKAWRDYNEARQMEYCAGGERS